MTPHWQALLLALREPARMAAFDDATWDLLMRQALSAGVLGRLAALARQAGIEAALPLPVRRHMGALLAVSDQQRRAVRWELVLLSRDLAALRGPVLLLKGAAYVAGELPPAPGRLFSDIDLLVPRDQLDEAEAALMLGGWVSAAGTAYDERYYRQWMHELPPMVHLRRQTNLDLHHNILPLTARIKTPSGPLLAAAQPVPEFPRFSVPAPVDQVLHSATHLMHEGEWGHGLRDLADLDSLLRLHGREAGFWEALLARAALLNLGRPLFYALTQCRRWLHTPVPDDVLARCPSRPGRLAQRLMDAVLQRALTSAHRGSTAPGTRLAEFMLYVRSHYLRMPLHLLLPHLIVKAVSRPPPGRDQQDEADPAAQP
ncbi:nucleotidyltransferase family protein [Roseateles sp.]|uniref:nucleotidyltransferase domain-containing protein n=1 Tax=Roseateles sp. TaxID=1971397 RepID=UPI002DFE2D8B|nr:nucleotidyltransferase family protein [Roseateles sp.]